MLKKEVMKMQTKTLYEQMIEALDDYQMYANHVRNHDSGEKILNSDLYLEIKWERYQELKKLWESENAK